MDKKLDEFNPNENRNYQDDNRNAYFANNRGGHTLPPRGNSGYNNRRGGYRNREWESRDRPNFTHRNEYGDRRPPYNKYRNDNQYSDRYYGEQRRPPPRYYNDYNNNRNNNYNNSYRENNNPNFNRNFFNEEIEEFDEQIEIKKEKEKSVNEFKKKYGKIMEEFKILFINESLKEEQIIQILNNIISNPNLTIFEAMNSIYRQVHIIKTLNIKKENRQYGPNKDILYFEFEENMNKKNLVEVIQKYKIYKTEEEIQDKNNNEEEINLHFDNDNNEEIFNKEIIPNYFDKSWLYVDNFDKRRKLVKDEEGYFNYLPIMNPEGKLDNKDDDIYAKNENEISYHALFYKTQMCKECNISKDNKIETQLLCPYAHDILKDFRIIYKYTDEDTCKFMSLLLDSKLFIFQNYKNYIPMSLSPEFNIDTFKVHKCQLDEGICPNDYHVCPYYHKKSKVDDARRPPLLFGYSGGTGDICFNAKKKEYCPEKCLCGIFCRFIHNKNEFNYHWEHFRKEFDCKRPKKNGKCIYYKTCYGKHPKNEELINDEEKEEEEEVDFSVLDDDEDINKIEKKIKTQLNVAKSLRCRKCQNIKNKLCIFIECKHFCCFDCYRKIFRENKKKKETNNLCPFCYEKIKTIARFEFK